MRRIDSPVVVVVLAGLLWAPRALSDGGTDPRARTAGLRNEAQQLIRESLDGRSLVVRVYRNLQSDPEGFTKVSIRLADDVVQFRDIETVYPSISKSCVVLFWPPDQTDEVVAAILDRFLYAGQYSETGRVSVSNLLTYRRHVEPWWTILDAAGQPIPKASVEIRVDPGNLMGQIPVGQATTDEHGRIERWLPAGRATFALTASHPNYGTATAMYMHSSEEPSGIYVVPLVPLNSEAAARGIQATVTDTDGRPVPGAEVECVALLKPDGSRVSPHQRILSHALTNDEGWFALCPSVVTEEFVLQGLPPAGTRYQIHVRPPKWANLRQSGYDRPNLVLAGTRTTITLTPMEAEKIFHTFAFEDFAGPVTKPEELRNIVLSLHRDGREWVCLTYDQYKDGYALPPGVLRATTTRAGYPFQFSQIELAAESPEHLTVTPPEPIICRGHVVSAETEAPLPGAFVVGGHRHGRQDPCSLTDEQWAELYSEAIEQGAIDAPDVLMRIQGRVAMTDADGAFELSFYPAHHPAPSELTVLARGYRRETEPILYLQPNASGSTNVPTFRLRAEGPIHFPTFVFEDESGPVTDPNKLEVITLEIRGLDNTMRYRRFAELGRQREFVAGRYYAEAVWERRHYIFGPVDLTEPTLETVVFKPREIRIADVVYQGQVVEGITGRPVSGALVVCGRFGHFQDAASLTPAQWAAIRSLGRHPDVNDPALAPLLMPSDFSEPSFTRVALTDEKGWFDMVLSQAEMSGHDPLIIHAEDYVLVTQLLQFFGGGGGDRNRFPRFETHVPDENGIVTLPPIRLYPAGAVRLAPVLPDPGIAMKRQRIRFRWRVQGDNRPAWVEGLYRTGGDSRRARTMNTYELRPNVEQTVYVPAGVDLGLSMSHIAVREPCPPVSLGSVRLRQGETLGLGRVEFDPGIPISVKVVDRKGQPVSRIAVRCADEDGSILPMAQRTDTEGIVHIRVWVNSCGKLVVIHYDRDTREATEESTPYEVAGAEDTGKEFTLQLSDEMIQLVQPPRSPR